MDASTANRAEVLDDIVNVAEKNQVSSTYILGDSRSALESHGALHASRSVAPTASFACMNQDEE